MKLTMVSGQKMGATVVPCALVGDGMVGKTSLALAFVNKQVPDTTYVATIFDNYAGKPLYNIRRRHCFIIIALKIARKFNTLRHCSLHLVY